MSVNIECSYDTTYSHYDAWELDEEDFITVPNDDWHDGNFIDDMHSIHGQRDWDRTELMRREDYGKMISRPCLTELVRTQDLFVPELGDEPGGFR